MNLELDDTIAALASAAGASARGIIRLSGSDVVSILEKAFAHGDSGWPGLESLRSPGSDKSGASLRSSPGHPDAFTRQTRFLKETGFVDCSRAHRYAGSISLTNFRTPVPVDLYLWPNGRSYTGQPAAELHLPGSPPLLEAVLSKLFSRGARPARPGEFTLRAFLAGRIDLVQAEAVLGVIDADDQPQLKTALAQLAGGISSRIESVQVDLLNLLADLEAGLDFVEDDIEFVSRKDLLSRIESAQNCLAELLAQASTRMISTGRRTVVIAGLPNAGKSTLFNALAGRDSALVSNESGTTRDYLAAECEWNGTAIRLIDTAGWEKIDDELSVEAQQQRRLQLEQADIVLWCTASDLTSTEHESDQRLLQIVLAAEFPVIVVQTKADLAGLANDVVDVSVSAATGSGLPAMMERCATTLSHESTEGQELVGTTAARCHESLQSAADALDRAYIAVANDEGEEIIAIDLHDALEHLGRILGRVYTDDILDRLFSRFCIGK